MKNLTITTQSVNEHYNQSAHYGFLFSEAQKNHDKQTQKSQDLEAKTKSVSNVKMVVAFFAGLIAIGSCGLEAINVQACMSGMLGVGYIGSVLAGIVLTSLGLVAGYSLKKTSENIDQITGRRVYEPMFWISALLCIIYVGGQIAIAIRASAGLTGEAAFTAASFIIFIMIVCCIELVVGYLYIDEISEDAIDMVKLYFRKNRIKLDRKQMGFTSRWCDREWLYYEHAFREYNITANPPLTRMDETANIRTARDYFRSSTK
jgi:hypothetical protein